MAPLRLNQLREDVDEACVPGIILCDLAVCAAPDGVLEYIVQLCMGKGLSTTRCFWQHGCTQQIASRGDRHWTTQHELMCAVNCDVIEQSVCSGKQGCMGRPKYRF